MSELGYATWSLTPELQRPDFEPHTPGGCVDLGYRQIHGMTCKDAKLIAAAPDMLDALQSLCEYLPGEGECLNQASLNEGRMSTYHRASMKARAVIAKAKGKA